jgi:hypothetical protein
MRTRIDAAEEHVRERANELLLFCLAGSSDEIDEVRISIEAVSDPLGRNLTRCRAQTQLRRGDRVEIEELQPNLDRAVTRALERCRRTIRRRLTSAPLTHPT